MAGDGVAGEIPVSIIVVTKNEEANITRCLRSLRDFRHVVVVDSQSSDRTVYLAKKEGAEVVSYLWDGQYPKKRGWCLETLSLPNEWVLWVDADEVVQPDLIEEIRGLFADDAPEAVGYFIRSAYIWKGRRLNFGLKNNKIALMNRFKMTFPVVDDLDIEGMGEIEGHYQPVLIEGVRDSIGQLRSEMLHFAYDDAQRWEARHERYARWEAEMNEREAWPDDPVWWREIVKRRLRRSALRPFLMFFISYVLKFGFLDGRGGLEFALSRKRYCEMIRDFESV